MCKKSLSLIAASSMYFAGGVSADPDIQILHQSRHNAVPVDVVMISNSDLVINTECQWRANFGHFDFVMHATSHLNGTAGVWQTVQIGYADSHEPFRWKLNDRYRKQSNFSAYFENVQQTKTHTALVDKMSKVGQKLVVKTTLDGELLRSEIDLSYEKPSLERFKRCAMSLQQVSARELTDAIEKIGLAIENGIDEISTSQKERRHRFGGRSLTRPPEVPPKSAKPKIFSRVSDRRRSKSLSHFPTIKARHLNATSVASGVYGQIGLPPNNEELAKTNSKDGLYHNVASDEELPDSPVNKRVQFVEQNKKDHTVTETDESSWLSEDYEREKVINYRLINRPNDNISR